MSRWDWGFGFALKTLLHDTYMHRDDIPPPEKDVKGTGPEPEVKLRKSPKKL